MILSERLAFLFLVLLIQTGVEGSVIVKRDNEGVNYSGGLGFEKSLFGGPEERNLEQEIMQEINHLSARKQREIFYDLEKQNEKFNTTKSLVLSETENLSPLNVEELKNIRKTIKTSNSSLPAIRNKRTLNFLLFAVARAMGYTLTPTNPDAEWIPRQQPSAQPCTTPSPSPPPCMPNPPASTPSPCAMPPTTPPCPGSALTQPATIPPNQIDANTISYPFRPARTIPLFNFAPLPAGIRVPYPPLLQPLVQQRSPCTPQQPPPPPCSTPAPSPPPCTTPAPSPKPCSTPAPSPPPCKPTPAPPCTTPAPKRPPCTTTPAPPPCTTTPAPPPCTTTPAPPPCTTTPAPPPCTTTPAPPPCTTTPAPPPCKTPARCPPCPPQTPSSPPPPPSAEPPKKGSILLEYDDPVRIKIFSNDRKYLPVSGSIYSGRDDDDKDWHSHFHPESEKNEKKDEDFEEMEEEHIEEEEEEEPGQLKHYEEEDERVLANEEEEDESETSLSVVKKPADQDIQRTRTRQLITTKTKASLITDKDNKNNEKENKKHEKSEKLQKMKKPKRKKWIRIIKKQRRKTKTDSNPDSHYQIDSFPEASEVASKYYGKRASRYESYERDDSDFDDSASHSTEDVTQIDLKKIIVNKNPPELLKEARQYEFNFNPFALEPEDQRRKKLEKAVERYVEDYVEKQLGDELIKNTGVPKTTVFEFAPKNGPKIQTITTTVAKHTGNPTNFKPLSRPEARSHYKAPPGNTHVLKTNSYEENLNKRGGYSYEAYHAKK